MKICILIGRVCLSCMSVGLLLVNLLGVVSETAVDCLRRQGSEEFRFLLLNFLIVFWCLVAENL